MTQRLLFERLTVTGTMMATILVVLVSSIFAATYHLDSRTGSDDNDGLSPETAWKTIAKVNAANIQPGDKVLFARDGLWRGTLKPHSGIEGNPVYYGAYGEGVLPKLYGSVEASHPENWTEVLSGIWATENIQPITGQFTDNSRLLYCDVGNIIFNHGEYKKLSRCGIKKWSLEDCKSPGDYWYNTQDKRVYLRFDGNPGQELDSIELALRDHVVDQGACHDIIYENLAVAYGAAHGFGGGSTKRLTIRLCDIYYIGGGHQFTHPNGYPVRFGNGIEFWGNCDGNLVEKCRIWEVYDAALTNQGRVDKELNTIYRDNLIWNSEYSFEYWNADVTENILFENNICLDAGFGWGHGQRPDKNGAHLMFYNNPAKTKNFVIRNNVFHESTEVCIRMENDWRSGLTLEGNQYYQSEKPIMRWCSKTYYQKDELKKMVDELGLEKTGTFAPYAEKQ